MSENPNKLSDLTAGTVYTVKADTAEGRIQIIRAGQFPTCLAWGFGDDSANEDEVLILHLIGWASSINPMGAKGFNLFYPDTEPDSDGWLLALRIGDDNCPKPMMLGLGPEISEMTDEES